MRTNSTPASSAPAERGVLAQGEIGEPERGGADAEHRGGVQGQIILPGDDRPEVIESRFVK
jgi:hypothetical protein